MKITLVVDVPKLRTTQEGQDFASALADHIVETFNDDTSIKSVVTSVPKQQKGHGTA